MAGKWAVHLAAGMVAQSGLLAAASKVDAKAVVTESRWVG
jgi:hypothetical protein